MSFWKIVKALKYSQIRRLFFLALKYPMFMYPTLKATANSYRIAKEEYPETHHLSGKGNAFRHALWNLLICYECLKWNKDRIKVVAWAKVITDKHEELSPNKPLEKAMDIYNNDIGRALFEQHNLISMEDSIELLKDKLVTSKKVESIADIDSFTGELVYINNDI